MVEIRGIGRFVGRSAAGAVAAGGVLALQARRAGRRDYIVVPPPGGLPLRAGTKGPALTLVVIGDSTGAGLGAARREDSYPVLLARLLGEHYSVRLHVLARPGVRMADARELATKVNRLEPDIVLLGVGGNDAIHLTPLSRVESVARDTISLSQAAGADVVVALGPSMDAPAIPRPLRDAAAWRCRQVNAAIRRAARGTGAVVVDLHAEIGDAFRRDPERLYSADLFHPSSRGYALWAGALRQPLLDAAERRSGAAVGRAPGSD